MIFSDGHLQFACERLGARRTEAWPRRVGTTRTVDMRGGIIDDEEYLV